MVLSLVLTYLSASYQVRSQYLSPLSCWSSRFLLGDQFTVQKRIERWIRVDQSRRNPNVILHTKRRNEAWMKAHQRHSWRPSTLNDFCSVAFEIVLLDFTKVLLFQPTNIPGINLINKSNPYVFQPMRERGASIRGSSDVFLSSCRFAENSVLQTETPLSPHL